MVLLFIDTNIAVYVDSFGFECICQEVLDKIKDKFITHNTFSTQADDSIICGL